MACSLFCVLVLGRVPFAGMQPLDRTTYCPADGWPDYTLCFSSWQGVSVQPLKPFSEAFTSVLAKWSFWLQLPVAGIPIAPQHTSFPFFVLLEALRFYQTHGQNEDLSVSCSSVWPCSWWGHSCSVVAWLRDGVEDISWKFAGVCPLHFFPLFVDVLLATWYGVESLCDSRNKSHILGRSILVSDASQTPLRAVCSLHLCKRDKVLLGFSYFFCTKFYMILYSLKNTFVSIIFFDQNSSCLSFPSLTVLLWHGQGDPILPLISGL